MPKPHTPRSAARAFSIILCPTNSGQPYRFSLSPPLAYDDKANFPSGRGDDGQPSSAWDTPPHPYLSPKGVLGFVISWVGRGESFFSHDDMSLEGYKLKCFKPLPPCRWGRCTRRIKTDHFFENVFMLIACANVCLPEMRQSS